MSVTREQVRRYISEQLSEEQVNQLIEQHVDADPAGIGIARARVRGTGTTVAAVIMGLEAEDGDVEKAARDYDLTVEQVLGAVFFYWDHQDVIDAEITVRNSWFAN